VSNRVQAARAPRVQFFPLQLPPGCDFAGLGPSARPNAGGLRPHVGRARGSRGLPGQDLKPDPTAPFTTFVANKHARA
jgi:hypothetical protein